MERPNLSLDIKLSGADERTISYDGKIISRVQLATTSRMNVNYIPVDIRTYYTAESSVSGALLLLHRLTRGMCWGLRILVTPSTFHSSYACVFIQAAYNHFFYNTTNTTIYYRYTTLPSKKCSFEGAYTYSLHSHYLLCTVYALLATFHCCMYTTLAMLGRLEIISDAV